MFLKNFAESTWIWENWPTHWRQQNFKCMWCIKWQTLICLISTLSSKAILKFWDKGSLKGVTIPSKSNSQIREIYSIKNLKYQCDCHYSDILLTTIFSLSSAFRAMKSQEFSAVSLALQAPGQRGKSATRLERLSDRHRCPFYSKHLPAQNNIFA